MRIEFNKQDIQALHRAVDRNPEKILSEVRNYFVKAINIYNQSIVRSPWRMGMSGGGAPVATHNLRDSHRKEIHKWEARIFPDQNVAKYAPYVHGIEGFPRKRSYQLRPWLDFAKEKQRPLVEQLEFNMLKNIVNNLAS
jgi:hypothetical protein